MSEAEWLACTDPEMVLAIASELISNRKLRLVAVGCWSHLPPLPNSAEWREAVQVAERYADGAAEPTELAALTARRIPIRDTQRHNAQPADVRMLSIGLERLVQANDCSAADIAVHYATGLRSSFARGPFYRHPENIPTVLGIIRCIAGNPFCPVVLSPDWVSSTVVSLAEGIYQDRAFDRLPILADALQDTGCENEEVLAHCRNEGPHVRGCWVVDRLLGKE
jgi:hypothetical protein